MRFPTLIVALFAVCICFLSACSNFPDNITNSEFLTYEQIKGSGLANKRPQLSAISRVSIHIDSDKSYIHYQRYVLGTNKFLC